MQLEERAWSARAARWLPLVARLRAALSPRSSSMLGRWILRKRRRRWLEKLDRLPIREDVETRGWVPIRVDLEAGAVGWIPGRSLTFRRGFFYETLSAALASEPPPPALCSGLAGLAQLGDSGAPRPNGFIFHISRCGSTLLGNMLLGSPRNLVLQEASSFNAVLRDFEGRVSESARIALLRGIAGAFHAGRAAQHENLFVKFTSWNVLALPLIQQAFPGVPWVFLYRDPVEVVTSNLRKPGSWVSEQHDPRCGPFLVGEEAPVAQAMSREEYCARVIDRNCRAALEHASERSLFIHYDQLSEACLRRILAAFGVDATDPEVAAMTAQRLFDSKDSHGHRRHREDRARKQRLAHPGLRDTVEKWTRESYEQLERRRIAL